MILNNNLLTIQHMTSNGRESKVTAWDIASSLTHILYVGNKPQNLFLHIRNLFKSHPDSIPWPWQITSLDDDNFRVLRRLRNFPKKINSCKVVSRMNRNRKSELKGTMDGSESRSKKIFALELLLGARWKLCFNEQKAVINYARKGCDVLMCARLPRH